MKKKISIILAFLLAVQSNVVAFYDLEDYSKKEDVQSVEMIKEVKDSSPRINAPSAIVFDRNYQKVLYGKNIHEKRPMASTTKIMTAIVAYENADMKEIVTVSKKAAAVGGSTIKLKTGDKVTLHDLMYGLLLCSGNDAAIAIAEHVGGSVEEFCEMMTDKAQEIGAKDSNFITPHGLDHEEHYSTAYDLAIMADYALNIPYIAEIVGTKNATIFINSYPMSIHTTNEMLSVYQGANGVKTGFTGDAGRCLVTSASKEDRQLISVILGCNTKNQRTQESIKMLNYGFEEFEIVDLCKFMEKEFEISVEKSKEERYKIKVEEAFWQPMSEFELENLEFHYFLEKNYIAPIAIDSEIGRIEVMVNKEVIKTIPIVLAKPIERKDMSDYFKLILKNMAKSYQIEMW